MYRSGGRFCTLLFAPRQALAVFCSACSARTRCNYALDAVLRVGQSGTHPFGETQSWNMQALEQTSSFRVQEDTRCDGFASFMGNSQPLACGGSRRARYSLSNFVWQLALQHAQRTMIKPITQRLYDNASPLLLHVQQGEGTRALTSLDRWQPLSYKCLRVSTCRAAVRVWVAPQHSGTCSPSRVVAPDARGTPHRNVQVCLLYSCS